ncbi:MAG: hypothetical protein KDD60_09970, partial [Bdellovibrionales bacterium]|nr:hypothetical protein [Bdellovibrionales bacterium]
MNLGKNEMRTFLIATLVIVQIFNVTGSSSAKAESDDVPPAFSCTQAASKTPVDMKFGEFRYDIGSFAPNWNEVSIELPASLGTLHYSSGHAAQLALCDTRNGLPPDQNLEDESEEEREAREQHCKFLKEDHGFGAAWRYGYNSQIVKENSITTLVSGDGLHIPHFDGDGTMANLHSYYELDSHLKSDSSGVRQVFMGGGNAIHNGRDGLLTRINEDLRGIDWSSIHRYFESSSGEQKQEMVDYFKFFVDFLEDANGFLPKFIYQKDIKAITDLEDGPVYIQKICSPNGTTDRCEIADQLAVFQFDEITLGKDDCANRRGLLRSIYIPATGDRYSFTYHPQSYLLQSITYPDGAKEEYCYNKLGSLSGEYENSSYTQTEYTYEESKVIQKVSTYNPTSKSFKLAEHAIEEYSNGTLATSENYLDSSAEGSQSTRISKSVFFFDETENRVETYIGTGDEVANSAAVRFSTPNKIRVKNQIVSD